jgi:hypothetical protein
MPAVGDAAEVDAEWAAAVGDAEEVDAEWVAAVGDAEGVEGDEDAVDGDRAVERADAHAGWAWTRMRLDTERSH